MSLLSIMMSTRPQPIVAGQRLSMLWFAMLTYLKGRSYLAARGFLSHLLDEVPGWTRLDGELLSDWIEDEKSETPTLETSLPQKATPGHLASMPYMPRTSVYWTRTQWMEPFILEFQSITQAARALKAIQRNWAPYPTTLQRRTTLIAEALPPCPPNLRPFHSSFQRRRWGGLPSSTREGS